jgi:GntR family transcriptional regulator, transcriptional repressor for pyruvate dehydrogenase complex
MSDSSHKVYQLIIDDIQNSIINGDLKFGDKLPTERSLVQKYNVSRSSVREALRILDVIGIIECVQGSGNFITNNFSDFCFEPISLSFKLQNGNLDDIMQLRNMFEIRSSILAATHIEPFEAEKLIKLSEKLKNADSLDEFNEIDKLIHISVVGFSRNKLLITLYNAISKLVEYSIKTKSSNAPFGLNDNLTEIHIKLCKAIASKNVKKTQQYAEEHANRIYVK